jgi:hypothetical protein
MMIFNKALKKNEDYFVIGLGVVLVFVVFGIVFVLTSNTPSQQPAPRISPTPRPILENFVIPPPIYNQRAQDRLLQKIVNRKPLVQSDTDAKAKILTLLPAGQKSGIIHQTNTITIDYTKSPDLFQVEIFTTNINSAKTEANNWFLSQGMSQQGICDLPVDFYLSWDVVQQLYGKYVSFSPMAPGCN